jgi:hypothetical protein
VAQLGPVRAELDLECARVLDAYSLAREMLAERALVPADARSFDQTSVRIFDLYYFNDAGRTFGGCYDQGANEILLPRRGIALLHELLHDWQFAHGIESSTHPHWTELGYWQADYSFQARVVPLDTPTD